MSVETLALVEADYSNGVSHLEAQYYRAKIVARMIGELGLKITVQMVLDRLIQGSNDPKRFMISNFRQPVSITGSDLAAYQEIITNDIYGLPGELSSAINGKAIVDAGANIGLSSAYFATRYPDSPVLAIEPHPRNYDLLEANSKLFEGQISPQAAGVAAEPGSLSLTLPYGAPKNHIAYRFSQRLLPSPENISAMAITPQDIASRLNGVEIGLLKVDIEGAEKEVFESPTIGALLGQVKLMLIETHDRFVPGCSEAVQAAASASGLELYPAQDTHTTIYRRV